MITSFGEAMAWAQSRKERPGHRLSPFLRLLILIKYCGNRQVRCSACGIGSGLRQGY
jgi:hypothetical protein